MSIYRAAVLAAVVATAGVFPQYAVFCIGVCFGGLIEALITRHEKTS